MDERAPATDTEAMEAGSHIGALRGLFAAGLDALRTRLDLATVEVELYLLRVVRMLLWALAALACALLALVFGLVSVVVALWDTHRMAGLLGGTLLFVVLAVIFGAVGARTFRQRPSILDGTLEQLEHDHRDVKGIP
ncbi:MAG: rane protein [Gammaproteobacteria bacterium]|nr:rane protein [Gammaproteobacteria bacterium]